MKRIKLLFLEYVYYKIKWHPWSPWSIATLNLAWEKYKRTSMYEERKKIDFMPVDEDYDDYAEQAYNDNREIQHFLRRFTIKDKIKVIFLPFSCGNHYELPFWRFKFWFYDIEND